MLLKRINNDKKEARFKFKIEPFGKLTKISSFNTYRASKKN